MLKTRVITAVVLLAVLLPILYFANYMAFSVVAMAFLGAAAWEAARLFQPPAYIALLRGFIVPMLFLVFFVAPAVPPKLGMLFALCCAFWAAGFVPALKTGAPPLASFGNQLLSWTYLVSILGCFAAIAVLFRHSPLYLLSVMVLVWIADIGAYFSGKAFGKRKLAPSISPGKSWEGAIGGGLAVLLLSALAVAFGGPALMDTFGARLQAKWGWGAMFAILLVITAASVVGDLFESMLKRRAGVKDSSNLLPGHGGVLDRIDALIPVLPLAALIDAWL
ncbi:MAG: phosphatidate cytidylyltransferase [Pseudomonadota bacterium]